MRPVRLQSATYITRGFLELGDRLFAVRSVAIRAMPLTVDLNFGVSLTPLKRRKLFHFPAECCNMCSARYVPSSTPSAVSSPAKRSGSSSNNLTTLASVGDNWERAAQRGDVNIELYLSYAESLAQNGQWKEALDVLASAHHHHDLEDVDTSDLVRDRLAKIVNLLTDPWTRSGVTTFAERLKNDTFSCSKCGSVLCEPVTIWCGHSYCRKCAARDRASNCVKCGRRQFHGSENPADLKTNVVISALVEKLWNSELCAVHLRNSGTELFERNRHQEALDKYNQAAQAAAADFILLSNRSNLHHKMGRFEEALQDASEVVLLRPDWPKGYFRRAVALESLGRNEEALLSFLHCVAFEKKLVPDICEDIVKVFLKVLIAVEKPSATSGQSMFQKRPRVSASSGKSSSENSGEDSLDEATSMSMPRADPLAMHTIKTHSKLHKLVDQVFADLERLKRNVIERSARVLDTSKVESSDVECTLCYRLLWQPASTPCGHTFCRKCLDRCLDHNPSCPLCKTSLENYLAERRQSLTEFIEAVMVQSLPNDYAERARINEEEMKEMASLNRIPIFICTMAFPTVRCPLHVFEPRYRLMIRRCMESGTRQFGMCAFFEDQPQGFGDFGTMLEVRDVEYFTDGRSVVDTVGGRRFKVLSRGMMDGYSTATVEFLVDQRIEEDRIAAVAALQENVRRSALSWIRCARSSLRDRIHTHFGTMPPLEADWMSLPNGPAWIWWLLAILPLSPKDQLAILSMTDMEKRLEAVHRVVEYVRRRTT